ncbi:MAG: DUF2953 domain-containing protein [Oscillospiraceae bacterium]|nr:DUF2953 domain-containing protein [Oscillospiraceae bacterium]MBO5917343.1 DUF2953 domain-containing protein [Oscillospiraceae bacterium]
MTGLWIALGVAAALLLLGQLRVGCVAHYSQEGFGLSVRLGAVRVKLLPAKPREKKPKKKTKAPPTQTEKRPIGGVVTTLVELLPAVLDAVKALFCRLRADKLELLLTVSLPDPADTAIRYGQANALLASLWTPLTQVLEVEDGHARVEMDYEGERTHIYLYVSLYLKLYQLVALAAVLGWRALRVLMKNRSVLSKTTRKSEVV